MATLVAMTRDEAEAAMADVQGHLDVGLTAFERATAIVKSVEARQGYAALGYATMADCLADRLDVTRRRGYQILHEMTGTYLMAEIAPVTRREARVIGAHPEIVERVKERVSAGDEPSETVRRLIAEQRQAIPKPVSKSRPVRGLDGLLRTMASLSETLEGLANERTAEDGTPPELERAIARLVRALEAMRD